MKEGRRTHHPKLASLSCYRCCPEAGQTVAAADSIQKDSGLSQGLDSLSHPGRNLTGINLFLAEVTAKRLEFLLVLVPGGWLWH